VISAAITPPAEEATPANIARREREALLRKVGGGAIVLALGLGALFVAKRQRR